MKKHTVKFTRKKKQEKENKNTKLKKLGLNDDLKSSI